MTRVVIAVSPSHFLRWHQQLRDTLAARWPADHVSFRLAPQGEPRSSAADRLLAMERLLLLGGKPSLCDRLDPPVASDVDADLVIDLAGNQGGAGERVLRPLYDGHPTDQAAVAALMSSAAPTIVVEDTTTGAILAEGLPSLEAASSLTTALEAVYSRMALLIEMAIAKPRQDCAPAARVDRVPSTPLSWLLRNLSFQCTRALYHLCCHSPNWRVGWRFTSGNGVIETGAITGAPWRLMLDREMGFAADPFPIEWGGRIGVFYERMNYRADRGEIWFQPFDDHGPAGEPVPAIREPWHLSYPFLIEEGGELYMIPEVAPGAAWPGARLHTLNRWGRLECIDGAILTPKYLPLRRLTQQFVDRHWSAAGSSVQQCAF